MRDPIREGDGFEPGEDGRGVDRRAVLRGLCSASMMLAAHEWLGTASALARSPSDGGNPAQAGTDEPLIRRLQLRTAAPLESMRAFYVETLGLKVLEESDGALTIGGGLTPITFVAAPTSDPEAPPWYHFAFNIPHNKIRSARDWQRARTGLVLTPERLRDPDYPDDVRHFRNWNAHSIFFWDPAGNLVEYIARHELDNAVRGPFGSEDILYASEIGLIVEDQQRAARNLHRSLGLRAYPAGTERWWAMGDARGLLLALRKRMWGEPGHRQQPFGVHPTEVWIGGQDAGVHQVMDFPYTVHVEG